MANKRTQRPAIRAAVFEKYKGKCAYCGCKLDMSTFTIDHIKPIRRHVPGGYGKDTDDNYNPCCGSCNSSKSSHDLEVWREELTLKINRARKDSSAFRMAEKFGLVKIESATIVFHFEKEAENG